MISAQDTFTAARVRAALTDAHVDLARGSKSEIEQLIAAALADARNQWPRFAEERGITITPGRKAPAEALASLVAYVCNNRHSSTANAVRDTLAALLLGGGRTATLRGLQFLSDEQAADLLDVLDGLLCGRDGRIYDETVSNAFQMHGAQAYYHAPETLAHR